MDVWLAEFFSMGHKKEYIDNLSLWDYYELISATSKLNQMKNEHSTGNKIDSKRTPTHLKMIQNAKKLNK